MINECKYLFTNNYGAYAIKSDDGTVTLYDVFTSQEIILTSKTARNTAAKILLTALNLDGINAAVLCSPSNAICVTASQLSAIKAFAFDSSKKNLAAMTETLINEYACGISGIGVLAVGNRIESAMQNAAAFEKKCGEYLKVELGELTPENLTLKAYANITKKKKILNGGDGNE